MNLNDTKIVVAIENAVCDQLEASGIKADPFRLDGEKIVQVIIEQLGGYVVVPKEPTQELLNKMQDFFCWRFREWFNRRSVDSLCIHSHDRSTGASQ